MAGDILTLPDLANSLELLRDSHCQSLYEGELAEAIIDWSVKLAASFVLGTYRSTARNGRSDTHRLPRL